MCSKPVDVFPTRPTRTVCIRSASPQGVRLPSKEGGGRGVGGGGGGVGGGGEGKGDQKRRKKKFHIGKTKKSPQQFRFARFPHPTFVNI